VSFTFQISFIPLLASQAVKSNSLDKVTDNYHCSMCMFIVVIDVIRVPKKWFGCSFGTLWRSCVCLSGGSKCFWQWQCSIIAWEFSSGVVRFFRHKRRVFFQTLDKFKKI